VLLPSSQPRHELRVQGLLEGVLDFFRMALAKHSVVLDELGLDVLRWCTRPARPPGSTCCPGPSLCPCEKGRTHHLVDLLPTMGLPQRGNGYR
jgi:hypothetical protein